ncbi:hypothetical protein GJ496_001213 [Pomphorhynchus laevis]|nr:hypothetical protein GJ496_001213 [Pomphorhynchus laevis]
MSIQDFKIEEFPFVHAYMLLSSNKFTRFKSVIKETTSFDKAIHQTLRKWWYDMHYKEIAMLKMRDLGSVDKYRIRKKYPPPETIWDGDDIRYSVKKASILLLSNAYDSNRYPSIEEKMMLAKSTEMTITQVNNWFKNKRQRERTSANKFQDILQYKSNTFSNR